MELTAVFAQIILSVDRYESKLTRLDKEMAKQFIKDKLW